MSKVYATVSFLMFAMVAPAHADDCESRRQELIEAQLNLLLVLDEMHELGYSHTPGTSSYKEFVALIDAEKAARSRLLEARNRYEAMNCDQETELVPAERVDDLGPLVTFHPNASCALIAATMELVSWHVDRLSEIVGGFPPLDSDRTPEQIEIAEQLARLMLRLNELNLRYGACAGSIADALDLP